MEYLRENRVLVLKVLALVAWAALAVLMLAGLLLAGSAEGWHYDPAWLILLVLGATGVLAWFRPTTGWKVMLFLFLLTQSPFLLASGLLLYLVDVFRERELRAASENRRPARLSSAIRLTLRVVGTLLAILAFLLLLEGAMIGLILIAIVTCLLVYFRRRPLTGGRSISLVAVLFWALPILPIPLVTEWYNSIGLGALAFFPGLMLLYVAGLFVASGAEPLTPSVESRSEEEEIGTSHEGKKDERAT